MSSASPARVRGPYLTQNVESAAGPACYHGGAFFDRIGVDFRTLNRRHGIINADVLDAWFPPAPSVMEALKENINWILRTSPPTQCEGLIDAIGGVRRVPSRSLVAGAGSSDLIFRAFPRWLSPRSSVLLLDPTYGEYQHVLHHVIGCHVQRFFLEASDGYRVDLDELGDCIISARPDLVILVNPNNPTGQHIRRTDLETFLRRMPESTRFWIDEAYLDYVDPGESLESFAAASPNVVVCKSMSKVYALSGARAAYLCAPPAIAAELRRLTPPWAVGLVAQIAAVRALAEPAYYRGRYIETDALRRDLAAGLDSLGLATLQGAANSILCTMPDGMSSAADTVAGAQRRGVFIRDISSMTARSADRVFRVAVKSALENATICRAIGESLCGDR